jgi:RND family efflux transporter MFP subunit
MKRKINAIFLVIAMFMVLVTGCTNTNVAEDNVSEENQYVPVEIEMVKRDTIYNTYIFSGKVYANKDVMVFPKIPGKVTNVAVEIGEMVNKGQTLFTLDKEDIQKQIDQAKAALDSAEANYKLTKEKIENAKTTFERTKQLYEQGAISKSQYEQAQLAASDNSLKAAESALNQAKVAYNQALDALDNISIEAPISGIVAGVNIEAGEMASNAQPAVTIVDMDKVYIQINVTENIINQLYNGQEVSVSIPAASEEAFSGNITNISPTVDQRTQLYPVKIYIDNNDHKIKPGMLAKVDINTDIKENVVVVRSEAVVEKNGEQFVYVADGNKAVERKVLTGLDTGTYIEIKEGLSEGEKVIVKGQNYVEDQTTVKVVRGE